MRWRRVILLGVPAVAVVAGLVLLVRPPGPFWTAGPAPRPKEVGRAKNLRILPGKAAESVLWTAPGGATAPDTGLTVYAEGKPVWSAVVQEGNAGVRIEGAFPLSPTQDGVVVAWKDCSGRGCSTERSLFGWTGTRMEDLLDWTEAPERGLVERVRSLPSGGILLDRTRTPLAGGPPERSRERYRWTGSSLDRVPEGPPAGNRLEKP